MKQNIDLKKDEFESFIESFSSSDSKIASAFEERLRREFLHEAQGSKLHSFISQITTMRKNLAFKVLFSLAIIAILITIVSIPLLPRNVVDLTGVIKQANAANKFFFESQMLRLTDANRYIETSMRITPGAKYEACSSIRNFPEYATQYETYRYYASDIAGLPLTKNVAYDEDGKIINYYLHNREFLIDYRGGRYAVKQLHENEITETPTASGDLEEEGPEELPTYFPDDAKVTMVDDSYTIVWNTNIMCVEGSSGTTKVVNKVWLDKDSYKVEKSEYFIDEVQDENLIYSNKLDFKSEIIEEVKLGALFNYDLEVETRLSTSDANDEDKVLTPEEMQAIQKEGKLNAKSFLSANPAFALQFTGFETYLTSVYGHTDQSFWPSGDLPPYLQDRNFYLEDERGTKQFEEVWIEQRQSENLPTISYNYEYRVDEITTSSVGLSIYEMDEDIDLLAQDFLYSSLPAGSIQVYIDDIEYTARLYKRQNLALYNPAEVVDESFAVALEYQGKILIAGSFDSEQIKDVRFKTVDANDEQKLQNFIYNEFEREMYGIRL